MKSVHIRTRKDPVFGQFSRSDIKSESKSLDLVSENSKEIETAKVFQSQIEKQEPENYATTINYQSESFYFRFITFTSIY